MHMSTRAKIYHNPQCSKSRETLALLREKGCDVEVIEYLKAPPTAAELSAILKALAMKAHDLVRTKEDEYKKVKIDWSDEKAAIAALVKHPRLIERPIVVNGKKAAIGRPPENILDIL